jgi:hypothetical protein
MAHTLLGSFTIFAASSLTSLAQAASSDLVGCWHGIRTVQYVADGSGHEVPGSDCTLAISATEMDSECVSKSGAWSYRYDYEVVAPGKYSATIRASSTRPDLVGSKRDYFYHVEADHLYITTFPQATIPAPPTVAVRVESDSVRIECKR